MTRTLWLAAALTACAAVAQDVPARPAPAPARLATLVGEYAWASGTLYVSEDGGALRAQVDSGAPWSLRALRGDTFAAPDAGAPVAGLFVFAREPRGVATGFTHSGRTFARRALGPEDGGQLRVTPVRPVPEILAEARRATPPSQPDSLLTADLVDLASLDAGIRFDIRYATTNNFLGTPFYESARALLQRPAAAALARAAAWLRERGYGLLVHDGYRPWYVTRAFWDATPEAQRWLVADPANGSRHNRGCAVDLTLYDLATGTVIDMGGTYDEATPRSSPYYPATTALQRWHRELLRAALEREGYRRNPSEWWHFDYRDWRRYPIMNVPFAEVR